MSDPEKPVAEVSTIDIVTPAPDVEPGEQVPPPDPTPGPEPAPMRRGLQELRPSEYERMKRLKML